MKKMRKALLALLLSITVAGFLSNWLPCMQVESRSYVTVGIGCTGGQHRSVYVVEQLAARLKGKYQLLVRHRQVHNLAGR